MGKCAWNLSTVLREWNYAKINCSRLAGSFFRTMRDWNSVRDFLQRGKTARLELYFGNSAQILRWEILFIRIQDYFMKRKVFERWWILRIIGNKLNWILADWVEAIWASTSSLESLSKQSSSSAPSQNLIPHQIQIQNILFLLALILDFEFGFWRSLECPVQWLKDPFLSINLLPF